PQCGGTWCRSLWICLSVSASLGGTARSPPVTLVSLGFFLAGFSFTVGFFVGRRDFFRAIVLLLVSGYCAEGSTPERAPSPPTPGSTKVPPPQARDAVRSKRAVAAPKHGPQQAPLLSARSK